MGLSAIKQTNPTINPIRARNKLNELQRRPTGVRHMTTELPTFEGWAIVELMGHRRLAGKVSTAELFGGSFLRLDVPKVEGDGIAATQFYGAAAIYCVTPTTEEIARRIAATSQPAPVARYELQLPAPTMNHDPEEEPDDENW